MRVFEAVVVDCLVDTTSETVFLSPSHILMYLPRDIHMLHSGCSTYIEQTLTTDVNAQPDIVSTRITREKRK